LKEYSGRDYFMVMESIFIRQNLQSGIILSEKSISIRKNAHTRMLLRRKNNPSESRKHFQDAWRCKDREPEAFSGCMQGEKRHPKTRVGEIIIELDHKYSWRGLLKNMVQYTH